MSVQGCTKNGPVASDSRKVPFHKMLLMNVFRIFSPVGLQTNGRKRRPNVALVVEFNLCCCIFCYGCMLAFVVLDVVFSLLSQEIG